LIEARSPKRSALERKEIEQPVTGDITVEENGDISDITVNQKQLRLGLGLLPKKT
jgi:hypothetical protein